MTTFNVNGLRSTRISIGMALAWTGVPLGMYFNYMQPNIGWSPVIMLLSVLLIIRYDRLVAGKIARFSVILLCILSTQATMLMYGIFSGNMNWRYTSFHIYAIFLIIALSSNTRENSLNYKVVLWTFILSGYCSVLGAYYHWNGLITSQTAWQLRQEDENYALEPFTASLGALVNFAAALCLLRTRPKLFSWLIFTLLLVDVYVVLWAGKRTPLIVMIAMISLFIAKNHRYFLKKSIFSFAFILVSSTCLYFLAPEFQLRIDQFAYNSISGVLNMFGDFSVSDTTGSASSRYDYRIWTYNYINENFSLINYILGGGYMTQWIDNPLLQSYLDMGVVGLAAYTFLIIIYPAYLMTRCNSNDAFTLSLLLCIYSIISTLNSGNPYLYTKWIPVIMLAYFAKETLQNQAVGTGRASLKP